MLRDHTNVITLRDKKLGGPNEILIQTMSNIKTSRVDEVLEQLADLEKRGLDIFRVSILDEEDLVGLKTIVRESNIPIVADIHFSKAFALKAIETGVDKIRLNPGNLSYAELDEVVQAAKRRDTAIRIGVNSGSLNSSKVEGDFANAYFSHLDNYIKVFKKHDYTSRLVIALKSSDPLLTRRLNEAAAEIYPYPIHIGITETGYGVAGMARSAVGLVPLLEKGIGNTIRISLSDEPKEEVKAAKALLGAMGLRKDCPALISCPTCGRTRTDVSKMARRVSELLEYIAKPIKVAVMGCPVNGPGEAKDADIGLAGTVDGYLVFKNGQPLKEMKSDDAYHWLKENIETF